MVANVHVDKLPSGSWRVRVSVGGRRASAVRRTRREAEIAGGELLAELGATPTSSSSVGELLDLHLAGHGYAPTTRAKLEWSMRYLPEPLLRRPVWQVTPAVIDQAYAQMRRAGAPAHAPRAAHTLLSSAFSRAVRWGWLVRNPVSGAEPPAEPRRELAPPTDDDVARAVDAAGGELATFLMLAATTGARRGELVGLQWRDLELEAHDVAGELVAGAVVIRRGVVYTPTTGVVVNEGKTERKGHRVIALDEATVAVLRAHRAQRAEDLLALGLGWRDGWFVFSSSAGERPWRPDYASARWRKLRGELGLERVRLHDLRHYMATSMLADGVAPTTVAGRLGHSTTATTLDRYAHFLRAADASAAARLGDRLRRAGEG
jgi:integrase